MEFQQDKYKELTEAARLVLSGQSLSEAVSHSVSDADYDKNSEHHLESAYKHLKNAAKHHPYTAEHQRSMMAYHANMAGAHLDPVYGHMSGKDVGAMHRKLIGIHKENAAEFGN